MHNIAKGISLCAFHISGDYKARERRSVLHGVGIKRLLDTERRFDINHISHSVDRRAAKKYTKKENKLEKTFKYLAKKAALAHKLRRRATAKTTNLRPPT